MTTIRSMTLCSALLAGFLAGCGETETTNAELAQRSTVSASCPGSLQTAVRIANSFQAPHGIGNPYSAGTCPISIAGLNSSGQPLQPNLALYAGQSASWFYPPQGSTSIVFTCFSDCYDTAILVYDTPNS